MTTDLTPGAEFGPSSWVDVPQERIDAFAEATGDHQWIHVDPERAAQGPFGTTIGHGYLTLSLLPAMSYEVVPRQDGGMAVNYGFYTKNKGDAEVAGQLEGSPMEFHDLPVGRAVALRKHHQRHKLLHRCRKRQIAGRFVGGTIALDQRTSAV